jgi:hypothetical protein
MMRFHKNHNNHKHCLSRKNDTSVWMMMCVAPCCDNKSQKSYRSSSHFIIVLFSAQAAFFISSKNQSNMSNGEDTWEDGVDPA